MELFSQARQYVMPACISFITVSILKLGLFVTPAELAQSLREMETATRAEYATQRDVADIKTLLNRMDVQLSKIDDRLNAESFNARTFNNRERPHD